MGFIRGTAVTFFSIILLLSLFLIALTLTVSWSLEYETLEPALKESATEFLQSSFNIDSVFEGQEQFMQSACMLQKTYTFSEEGLTFEIPCEIMQQGKDAILDYSTTSLVKNIYYTEYNCEFWECLKQSSLPFVLFSEKAKDYWRDKFVLLAIISFVLFALVFLISKKRSMTIIITGILIILAAFPFRKLDWVLKFTPSEFTGLFSVFFTKSYNVFLIMLIIGFIFIGVGLTFRFFGKSMKFMNNLSEEEKDVEGVSKSEVREIVKEEISKKNSKKKKK